MTTDQIDSGKLYRVDDERLGMPGTYTGADILKQLEIFAVYEDSSAAENDTKDWDIVESAIV